MDVRDLTYLQAIIETGSVIDAAERIGRTPPALTKAMRRLEGEIGCSLFTRAGRGIEPTAAARYLASNTQGVRQRLDSLRGEVASIASGKRGHVRIGVSATMAAIYLPALVTQLTSDVPDLRLTFVNGMNDVLRHALRSGELDLVLGVFDLPANNEFDGFAIAQDEVRPVAATDHALQGRRLAVEDLRSARWVLPAQAVNMRQWLNAAFITRGLPAPVAHIETSSIAILETLIAGSDLVSFVSSLKTARPEVRRFLAPLDAPDLVMKRKFGLMWSTLTPPGASTSLVIDHVRSLPVEAAIAADANRGGPGSASGR